MSFTVEGLNRAASRGVATRAEIVDAILSAELPERDDVAMTIAGLTQIGYSARYAADSLAAVLKAYNEDG